MPIENAKLNTSPALPESCKQLAEAELEQAKYWRPRRVGDLLFNFWD